MRNVAKVQRAAWQACAGPVADALHDWRSGQRRLAPEGPATAKYSSKRRDVLTRHLDNGHVSVCNNWIEIRIGPRASRRRNLIFVGSTRAGKRAASPRLFT